MQGAVRKSLSLKGSLKGEGGGGRHAESSRHRFTAEPQELNRLAIIGCVKAIIGWQPTRFIGSPNLGIASQTLLGKDMFIGQCSVEELTQQADKVLSRMVAIQCGGGSWMGPAHHLPCMVYDLSKVLTKVQESYDTTFGSLIGEFRNIWTNLFHREGPSDPKLVFVFASLGGTGRMHF